LRDATSRATSNWGTNGRNKVITLLGDVQGAWSRATAHVRTKSDTAILSYAVGIATLATALVAGLLIAGIRLEGPVWELSVLVAVAIVAERQPVRITSHTEITVSVLPMLFAAVVYGPLDAVLVGALGLVADFRQPYTRWLIWTSARVLAGGLASLAVLQLLPSSPTVSELAIAVVAAAVVETTVDSLCNATTVVLRGTGSCREFIRSVRPVLVSSLAVYVPAIAGLAYAYGQVSAWTVLLFFAPGFAAQTLYRLYREQREAAEGLAQANIRLQRANLSFATALVATLDARDRYTAGHSAAVAIYARDIAARMDLTAEEQQLAHLCGLVHDIGKIGLPPGLLEKPGALTLDERRQMETHSEIGERILANVDDYAEIAKVVRHHHERIDGEGYPSRIKGDEIPLLSRIIAVADAYNAMTSDRPYRDAMPSRVARMRLAQAVETQFDTTVVAAFEAILAGADEDYRTGVGMAFLREARQHDELDTSEVRVA
jgi:putative nucleotidyltransferase with HDIG domain